MLDLDQELVLSASHTLKETNKRGDWMKQWLMLQKFVAIHTTYRKIHQKLVKFKTPAGVEKQLDYILVNRKYLTHSRDAEANDMIHIGSDHRSVMARFVIPVSKQKTHPKEFIHYMDRTTRIKSTKMRSLKRLPKLKNDTVNFKGESCKKKLNVVENQG